jgi:hypothetical protein
MVTMDQVRDVTATFTLRQYTLTVNRGGTGGGTRNTIGRQELSSIRPIFNLN